MNNSWGRRASCFPFLPFPSVRLLPFLGGASSWEICGKCRGLRLVATPPLSRVSKKSSGPARAPEVQRSAFPEVCRSAPAVSATRKRAEVELRGGKDGADDGAGLPGAARTAARPTGGPFPDQGRAFGPV